MKLEPINFLDFKRLWLKADKARDRAIEKLKARLKETQKTCSHKRTIYYSDPAGGSDSFDECQDCGKQL